MQIACQEFVFWIGKGDKEETKEGQASLVYKVGIRLKFKAKTKTLSTKFWKYPHRYCLLMWGIENQATTTENQNYRKNQDDVIKNGAFSTNPFLGEELKAIL